MAFGQTLKKLKIYFPVLDHTFLALQETHLKDTDNVNIRGFDHYFKTCMSEVDGTATGGCSIFLRKVYPMRYLSWIQNCRQLL